MCLTDSLLVWDVDSGDDNARAQPLKPVGTELLFAARGRSLADGGTNASRALSLEAGKTLIFESAEDHAVSLMVWRDPLGCRPALCFTPCPKNARCLGNTRCGPTLHDGLTSGATFHRIEYGKAPEDPQTFDVAITPVSARGCPEEVVSLLEAGAAELQLGESFFVSVTVPGRAGTGTGAGGGGGGGCLPASTAVCTPLGSDGLTSTCIDPADYSAQTGGKTLPSSCAPEGTTGCQDSSGALVKPCCAGLTCRVGSACGGGSVTGGVCRP